MYDVTNMMAVIHESLYDMLSVFEQDDGIGAYEYWGIPGNHVDLHPYCDPDAGDFEVGWVQPTSIEDTPKELVVRVSKCIHRNVKYYPSVDEHLGDEVPVEVTVECVLRDTSATRKADEGLWACEATAHWKVLEVEYGRSNCRNPSE